MSTPNMWTSSATPTDKLRTAQLNLDRSESQVDRLVRQIQVLHEIAHPLQDAKDFEGPDPDRSAVSDYVPGEQSVSPSFSQAKLSVQPRNFGNTGLEQFPRARL